MPKLLKNNVSVWRKLQQTPLQETYNGNDHCEGSGANDEREESQASHNDDGILTAGNFLQPLVINMEKDCKPVITFKVPYEVRSSIGEECEDKKFETDVCKSKYSGCDRRKQSSPRKIVKNVEDISESSTNRKIELGKSAEIKAIEEDVTQNKSNSKCGKFIDALSVHVEVKQPFSASQGCTSSLQTFNQPTASEGNAPPAITKHQRSNGSSHDQDNTFVFTIDDQFVSPKRKGLKCRFCCETFSQKTTLKAHVATHTGDKRYVCKICGRNYAQKSHLTYHIMSHVAVKNYKCEKCGKRFVSMVHLRRHTHANSKELRCEYCNRLFPRKEAIKNHISIFHKNAESGQLT